jgi:hypothetical protein
MVNWSVPRQLNCDFKDANLQHLVTNGVLRIKFNLVYPRLFSFDSAKAPQSYKSKATYDSCIAARRPVARRRDPYRAIMLPSPSVECGGCTGQEAPSR